MILQHLLRHGNLNMATEEEEEEDISNQPEDTSQNANLGQEGSRDPGQMTQELAEDSDNDSFKTPEGEDESQQPAY